jgi:eukaryotic-like serine/threonine-protein kinase
VSTTSSAAKLVAGRYRLERRIGRGGSGSVYAAHDLANGRSVALKRMRADERSGVGRQRFEREVAVLQSLSHPNVVPVLDHGHDDRGLPFIVFPLLSGCSLKSLIAREGALSPRRTARIAVEVLSALEAMHAHGVLHRDLKPDNIFLCHDSGEEKVWVLDFGLAKALGEQRFDPKLTAVGLRVGTPRYMSPEMARGETVGEASDLYALALVMAEMICGKPLLAVAPAPELLQAHASSRSLQLPDAVLTSPLFPVLQRALSKAPSVRYRTALQMRADVDALLSELEAGARIPPKRADLAPTQLALPAVSLPPSRRTSALAVALLFALLATASAMTSYLLAG